MQLKLTQYLYNYEEVKLSFIYSILSKQDISEVYFWGFELYYSNGDIFPILWEMYYDYYYELNPKFESYINKKQCLWEQTKDDDIICYVIKNIHLLKNTSNIFMIRQLYLSSELCQNEMVTFKLKGRPPSCLVGEDKMYHYLFYWIYKHNWVNIIYYLKKMMRDGKSEEVNINKAKDIYMNIIRFCLNKLKLKLENESEPQRELNYNDKLKEYETKWDAKKYSEDYHFILKTLFKFIGIHINTQIKVKNKKENLSETKVNRKHNLYICPNKEEIDSIKSLLTTLDNVPKNKEGDILVYKILSYKRQYPLYDEIGSFKLVRFNISYNEYKKENWYNWEYYASFMPIWEKRIKQFRGIICHDSKKVVFENDDDYEGFYELYGYDFDEQSVQIQGMSLLNIDKKMPIEWINRINHLNNDSINSDSHVFESFKQLDGLII